MPRGGLAVIWDLAAAINVGSLRSSWCSNLGSGGPGIPVRVTGSEARGSRGARYPPYTLVPFGWLAVGGAPNGLFCRTGIRKCLLAKSALA